MTTGTFIVAYLELTASVCLLLRWNPLVVSELWQVAAIFGVSCIAAAALRAMLLAGGKRLHPQKRGYSRWGPWGVAWRVRDDARRRGEGSTRS